MTAHALPHWQRPYPRFRWVPFGILVGAALATVVLAWSRPEPSSVVRGGRSAAAPTAPGRQ